jgi:hypothetical protein
LYEVFRHASSGANHCISVCHRLDAIGADVNRVADSGVKFHTGEFFTQDP